MTKKDYIAALAQESGFTKKAVVTFLTAQKNIVDDYLPLGDSIPLIDGLKLVSVESKGREYKNPLTGEPIVVPDRILPKARITKPIRDLFK